MQAARRKAKAGKSQSIHDIFIQINLHFSMLDWLEMMAQET